MLAVVSDLYYGGEALTAEQPQAFTCPYCGKMGYTEATLQEHVTTDHADSTIEVVSQAFLTQIYFKISVVAVGSYVPRLSVLSLSGTRQ